MKLFKMMSFQLICYIIILISINRHTLYFLLIYLTFLLKMIKIKLFKNIKDQNDTFKI